MRGGPACGQDGFAGKSLLSMSLVFLCVLSFSSVFSPFCFVLSRVLVLSVLCGSLLLLLLVHLRFLRAGGTADRLASLQRPRVFAQAARGPAARMCAQSGVVGF